MNDIHQAARSGNLDEIRRLIAEGCPVDSPEEDTGRTPLMVACISADAGCDVLELFIDQGADVNASARPEPQEKPDYSGLIENEHLDPELRVMLEKNREMLEGFHSTAIVTPLIVEVAGDASLEKLKLLVKRGADLRARSSQGYTVAITAAHAERMDVLDFLVEEGVRLDGETSYGESGLGVLSHRGRFAEVAGLLALGADPGPLEWTPLMHAVISGSLLEVENLVDGGADLEARDGWERTAFLLSVHAGDCAKAALLLAKGASRFAKGRCGHPPLSYPATRDDTLMLCWLLDRAFDPEETDDFGNTPLMDAAEHGSAACFRILLEAGADWRRMSHIAEPLVKKTSEPEIIRLLIDYGANPADLEADALREFIGLGTAPDLPVSEEEYHVGRSRRFGTANPERMQVPFWNAMVRCGWSGFRAAEQFGDSDSSCEREEPVWCQDRFGMSSTILPDGRFIQIAGEHEDSYDPDFCIYNDVFVHDGKGGFEILGYPEEVFPPTDFHSATYIAPWIYIIGNLGYPATRNTDGGRTPVYRLHTETGAIERVPTSGDSPGRIYSHQAVLEDDRIRISGGKVVRFAEDGSQTIEDQSESYWFDVASAVWKPIAESRA